MKRLSLWSFAALSHFFIVILALAAATLMGWYAVDKMLEAQTRRALERALPIFSARLMNEENRTDSVVIDQICKNLFKESGYRFTVMNSDGRVLGDGEGDPEWMRNHANRPEFIAALNAGSGTNRRVSDSVNREMLYTAERLDLADETIIVRVAEDIELVKQPLGHLWYTWRGVSLMLLLAAVLISGLLARFIANPLQTIRQRVSAFEAGDFSRPVPHCRLSDINLLASDLNRMAQRLDDRISTVERQRDEEDALLGCMIEGVVAIDMNKRILRINRSAAKLFGVQDHAVVTGESVLALIRNPECIALFERVLGGESPVEGFVELDNDERVLQTHGAALMGANGHRLGALLVFNDVTAMSRVETMQRDFVANVSHELKTPITSIKGFAETLLEGADDDAASRRRFLDIILKQANRLQSIVSDILSLAALENGMRSPEQKVEGTRLNEMLENALLPCRNLAAQHGIKLVVNCCSEEPVEVYPFFLEQAVMNLVDNAIKFSPPEGVVTVTVEAAAEITIRVKDAGAGIAREHHERLWERFYRVDRGRSRQIGGTGLGLAIVKRVAVLHGGRVEVDSAPGKGSCFSIIIPKRRIDK